MDIHTILSYTLTVSHSNTFEEKETVKETLLILLFSLLLIAACGGGEAPAAETADQEVINEPVDIAEEPVLYPEGTIDPSAVETGAVIAATDLNSSFYAWEGQEITLAAYPYIWYGDSTVVETELKLVLEPESTDDLARVNFDETQDRFVYRGEIIAVSGTFEAKWFGAELNSARFVDPPEDLQWIETSPYVYQGEPIPVDQCSALFNPWTGREVVVEGYYNSTTTSTTDYGVTIRVDLSDPDNTGNKLVACEMAEEIPEETAAAMSDNRNGVQIRGTVADESFNMVGLENCVVVNR